MKKNLLIQTWGLFFMITVWAILLNFWQKVGEFLESQCYDSAKIFFKNHFKIIGP
jgi:hypothetical protein